MDIFLRTVLDWSLKLQMDVEITHFPEFVVIVHLDGEGDAELRYSPTSRVTQYGLMNFGYFVEVESSEPHQDLGSLENFLEQTETWFRTLV